MRSIEPWRTVEICSEVAEGSRSRWPPVGVEQRDSGIEPGWRDRYRRAATASGSVRPKQPIASRRPSAAATPASAPRSPPPDRVHRQRALDRDQRADAAVAGFQLQAGQAVGGGRGACAAVTGEVHTEDPELAQPGASSAYGISAASNHSPTSGTIWSLDERTDGVADVALLVGEEAVDAQEVLGADLGRGGSGAHGQISLRMNIRRNNIEPDGASARRPDDRRLLARARGTPGHHGPRRPRRHGDQGRATGSR